MTNLIEIENKIIELMERIANLEKKINTGVQKYCDNFNDGYKEAWKKIKEKVYSREDFDHENRLYSLEGNVKNIKKEISELKEQTHPPRLIGKIDNILNISKLWSKVVNQEEVLQNLIKTLNFNDLQQQAFLEKLSGD